ncbi:MAG: hypothetical protein IT378_18950 [Sandaracinaceae bacterium]|nr:hypothetical protein [Sandaracinaceae bacterium]
MRSATVSATVLGMAFVGLAACTAAKPNFAPDSGVSMDASWVDAARDGATLGDATIDGGGCSRFGFATCAADCDTYVWADEARCGDCATSCEATRLCVAGACRSPIATELALGADFTCALLTSGHVVCWGRDHQGQLGDRSFAPDDRGRADAVAVEGVDDAVGVSASGYTACAIRGVERTVECWGNNSPARFGDDAVVPANLRQALRFASDPAPVREVSVSDLHVCARTDAAVLCAGYNLNGQLGAADPGLRTRLLVPVPGLPPGAPRAVVAGTSGGTGFTCVAASDGQVYCFGANDRFQLGRDDVTMASSPSLVPGPSGVVQLGAGVGFVCARSDTGAVWCWGANDYGQLGNGAVGGDQATPAQVMGVPPIGALAVGGGFVLAVHRDGTEVWGWGARDDGQLGTGELMLDATGTPARLRSVGGATYSAYAGSNHAFVLEQQPGTTDILCAGSNRHLQLGLAGTSDRTSFGPTEALP